MKKLYIVLFILLITAIIGCSVEITKTPDQEYLARSMRFTSDALGIESYFLAFVPQETEGPLPVLYLLQGAGANPWGWTEGAELQEAANDYGMIIASIAPGEYPWTHTYTGVYVDYVVEISEIMDQTFDTIADNKHRAICGISLGGFGALQVASERKDIFGSASSLSGGFYVNADSSNYENLRGLELLIDCAQPDSLYFETESLHNKLVELNIPHIYLNPTSGDHNWTYWGSEYIEHFYFHSQFFKGSPLVDVGKN